MKLISPRPISESASARSHRSAFLLMLTSSLFFAAMSACAHAAGERVDWRFPAFARAALVFLLALAVARMHHVPLVWRGTRLLWVRSITGSISMLLTFYALTHLEIATAITLTNTFPLWVALLAWPVLGARPTVGTWLALAGGILGVILIERPHEGEFRWASATALAASVCTAIVMLGLNKLRDLPPLSIVVHFSAVATLVVGGYLASTSVLGAPIDVAKLADPVAILLLCGIAVCGTAGQIFMTRAFQIAPAQKLAVIGLSQVVFALGFDLLVWQRQLDLLTFAGISLVVAPVAWLVTHRRPESAPESVSDSVVP